MAIESSAIWTDAKIIAALIAACVSLLLAIFNTMAGRRNQTDLERLKHQLAGQASARDAKLEYEYEARKKLYNECGPLLFQLSEAAERGMGWIRGFAHSAQRGNLGAGPDSWVSGERYGYYLASSYYRLILPISLAKLLQRRLTHLDLSLDRKTLFYYYLTQALTDAFSGDFRFAETRIGEDLFEARHSLPYDPHGSTDPQRLEEPAVYYQQGVPRGILENAAISLIVRDGEAGERALDYAEFERQFLSDEASDVRQAFGRIDYLFLNFHPATRPVLWRGLLGQYFIYQAITRVRATEPPFDTLADDLGLKDMAEFDWRNPAQQQEVTVADIRFPAELGLAFARERVQSVLETVKTG